MALLGKRKKWLASGKLVLPGMNLARRVRLWKRESPLERRLHSSVIKHLNEKPGDLPNVEAVNGVAHDLVMMYAKQVKLPHKYMPRVKRLATLEMTPEVGPSEKTRQFKNIVGDRKKLVERVNEMDTVAHGFAIEDKLADIYLEDVLNKIKGPIYVKDKAGKIHEVSRAFLVTLVERAAQKAAISIADIKSTLTIHAGH